MDTKHSAQPTKGDYYGTTYTSLLTLCTCLVPSFILLGIGLVIVGAYIKKELDKHEDIMELLDLIDLGTFTLKSMIYTLIGVIIACGVFGIITSLTGGVGAFFGLRVLLIIYVIILVLVIVLELLILSLWINLLNNTNEQLKGLFEDLLKEYTGFNDITIYTVGWDLVFIFGCYDSFDEIFTKLGSAAISITTILLLVEITAIFFSILIVAAVSLGRKVGLLDQYKSA